LVGAVFVGGEEGGDIGLLFAAEEVYLGGVFREMEAAGALADGALKFAVVGLDTLEGGDFLGGETTELADMPGLDRKSVV
jgi:hypothetical protein